MSVACDASGLFPIAFSRPPRSRMVLVPGSADVSRPPAPVVATEREFAALYARHHAYVWRILRRLGVPDASLEDATQDVFIVVHRRRDALDPDASVRSWLFGIARRVAADLHRGNRRLRRRLEAVPEAPPAPALDEEVSRAEAASFVRRFLDRLDDGHRMVFVLADIEGLTAPEISEAMEIPVNTVYSRLRSTRKKFEGVVSRRKMVLEVERG